MQHWSGSWPFLGQNLLNLVTSLMEIFLCKIGAKCNISSELKRRLFGNKRNKIFRFFSFLNRAPNLSVSSETNRKFSTFHFWTIFWLFFRISFSNTELDAPYLIKFGSKHYWLTLKKIFTKVSSCLFPTSHVPSNLTTATKAPLSLGVSTLGVRVQSHPNSSLFGKG